MKKYKNLLITTSRTDEPKCIACGAEPYAIALIKYKQLRFLFVQIVFAVEPAC